MFLFCYFRLTEQVKRVYRSNDTELVLQPGDYTIEVYGAKGGDTSDGENQGGKGSYVKGNFHINAEKTIKIRAGQKGLVSKGGYPDGGKTDKGNLGGGGGSSQVYIQNLTFWEKLIFAAGGSGATGTYGGCNGGGQSTVYCRSSTGSCIEYQQASSDDYLKVASENYNHPLSDGGSSDASGYVIGNQIKEPGSGGGGGHFSGRAGFC